MLIKTTTPSKNKTKLKIMIIKDTNTTTITELELRNDIIIEFNDTNEIQSCIISFSPRLQKFVLVFNCKLIHSSKTFIIFKSIFFLENLFIESIEFIVALTVATSDINGHQ